jgi:AraC-like DNA-binding protein
MYNKTIYNKNHFSMKKQTIDEFLNPYRPKQYTPVLDGKGDNSNLVSYFESKPVSDVSRIVQSYWVLKTTKKLQQDFTLHALPDACVNVLFNQLQLGVAGITQLQNSSVELNLGKEFHFVGIQLNPGVFYGKNSEIQSDYVGTPYSGVLPLLEINKALHSLEFTDQIIVLEKFVHTLIKKEILTVNPTIEIILQNIDSIKSVSDIAPLVHKSQRQLQRIIHRAIGLSPRNFLKVIRFQQSFNRHYATLYTDQAHYINSFRKATGYTPVRYAQRFYV